MVETEKTYLDMQDATTLLDLTNLLNNAIRENRESKLKIESIDLKFQEFTKALRTKYKFPEEKAIDKLDRDQKGFFLILKDN